MTKPNAKDELFEKGDVKAEEEAIGRLVSYAGDLFWGDEPISREILESRLSSAAQLTPQPQLNLRGDKTTKMSTINEITKVAQSQGMLDIGFVATKEKRH